MAKNKIDLLADFPPISRKQWDEKITGDLKGRDYERALVWRTNEGFNVRPYYRQDDLGSLGEAAQQPGVYPYVRGTETTNEWLIRQDVVVNDTNEANAKAVDALSKGANSIGFIFKGCFDLDVTAFELLLKDINLEETEINLVCKCNKCKPAQPLVEYINKKGYDLKAVKASVNQDPISQFMLKGKVCKGMNTHLEYLKTDIEATSAAPGVTVISVNGKNFNNSGSSIVQELGLSLAQGAEYISKLTEMDLPAATVASNIKFNLAVGGNYFMEIAKLRAGRSLWAKIVKAFGVECSDAMKMTIHSETSEWNKTVYDPYVNMLRTQTEAMSATLGGTHSLTVAPFNQIFEETTPFSERIARNQQLLLKEESHFDKVVDPGAGSYYIETLTASITEQAWKIFLDVQEKGGFIAAFEAGYIQSIIKESVAIKEKGVATRRINILGINQFPNFTESAESEIAPELLTKTDMSVEGTTVETLKPYRAAQPLEALRYETDLYSKENKRPLAYMLTIGNLNFRKARAQFACNFFAVAGYSVADNNGFATIAEGIAAAKEAGAEIVVLCSSDDEYTTFAPEAHEAIAKESILVIAGAPACTEELKEKGINNFINVKSNLLGELNRYQQLLGIK